MLYCLKGNICNEVAVRCWDLQHFPLYPLFASVPVVCAPYLECERLWFSYSHHQTRVTKVSYTWIQKQTQNSENMSKTSVFEWENAKQWLRVFFDLVLSTTNARPGSQCVWDLWCFLKCFHHTEKMFSKPVFSQWVTVEPFIAFLLAWDLISKHKDLDRDLLSNSYIVL